MGAIHGKGRFQCNRCHQGFSWRLDLANHLQQCKAALHRCCWLMSGSLSSIFISSEEKGFQVYTVDKLQILYRETKDQQAEYYLLETCFLCGHQLSGVHSEEASFVKGVQKLYHSKRPLTEVCYFLLFC